MRRLVITETTLGSHKLYAAETSAGVRATGTTLEGTLVKLALGEPPVIADELHGLTRIFRAIRPTAETSQIAHGQASG